MMENPGFKIPSPENKEKGGLSRREFIRASLVMAGVAAGMGVAVKRKEAINKEEKKENTDKKDNIEQKDLIEEHSDMCLEKGEIPNNIEDDIEVKTIRQVINFDTKGEIKIDIDVMLKAQKIWETNYRTLPRFSESLGKGLRGVDPYLERLQEIFAIAGKKYGVELPEELIFLAIPESHWDNYAQSKKGARGVYQLTKGTAKLFNLLVEKDGIDERTDPLKCARAAAELLADLSKRVVKNGRKMGGCLEFSFSRI